MMRAITIAAVAVLAAACGPRGVEVRSSAPLEALAPRLLELRLREFDFRRFPTTSETVIGQPPGTPTHNYLLVPAQIARFR